SEAGAPELAAVREHHIRGGQGPHLDPANGRERPAMHGEPPAGPVRTLAKLASERAATREPEQAQQLALRDRRREFRGLRPQLAHRIAPRPPPILTARLRRSD